MKMLMNFVCFQKTLVQISCFATRLNPKYILLFKIQDLICLISRDIPMADVRFKINLVPKFDKIFPDNVRLLKISGKVTIENEVEYDLETCEVTCTKCEPREEVKLFGKKQKFKLLEKSKIELFEFGPVKEAKYVSSTIFACHKNGQSVINSYRDNIREENGALIVLNNVRIRRSKASTTICHINYEFPIIFMIFFIVLIKNIV